MQSKSGSVTKQLSMNVLQTASEGARLERSAACWLLARVQCNLDCPVSTSTHRLLASTASLRAAASRSSAHCRSKSDTRASAAASSLPSRAGPPKPERADEERCSNAEFTNCCRPLQEPRKSTTQSQTADTKTQQPGTPPRTLGLASRPRRRAGRLRRLSQAGHFFLESRVLAGHGLRFCLGRRRCRLRRGLRGGVSGSTKVSWCQAEWPIQNILISTLVSS